MRIAISGLLLFICFFLLPDAYSLIRHVVRRQISSAAMILLRRISPCDCLKLLLLQLVFLASACQSQHSDQNGARLPLHSIHLPPGFQIHLYAENVPDARSMVLTPSDILFVGTRSGNVFAVLDTNGDRHADQVLRIASGLDMPNGVAYWMGSLFVADVGRILRYDSIESRLVNPPKPVVVNNQFPSERSHGWKFIRIGPDNKLYVPVGAPCNVCDRGDPYAAILRMNLDGSKLEVFARGIRNTVGFDWDPMTKELWFTDNGRDMLGDNLPPDELNHATAPDQHFGFPYCHADTVTDPEYGSGHSCAEFVPPAINLGPHVAALGMRFYTGSMFPDEYRNQIFIAEHGSWNRSSKIGYRISLVRVRNNRATGYEAFAEGWLQGEQAWGRPVDVLVMHDGSMLVSDDHAGAIYRITYHAP